MYLVSEQGLQINNNRNLFLPHTTVVWKNIHPIRSKDDHKGFALLEPSFVSTDVVCIPCSPLPCQKKKKRFLSNYIIYLKILNFGIFLAQTESSSSRQSSFIYTLKNIYQWGKLSSVFY